jgi:enoyl-CoA hydratase
MDGICMGGGMGISQGASHRVVTEHSRLAMPETNIGLFPDVGGGWFLARCPGRLGEYLALTGQVLHAGDAIAAGLADIELPSAALGDVIEALSAMPWLTMQSISDALRCHRATPGAGVLEANRAEIDKRFGAEDLAAIVRSLEAAQGDWAEATREALRRHSPLMMAVTLEQIRRARSMSLADDLRMERDMVRHCFHRRHGAGSETVEGIRALAIDKDRDPRWNPATVAEVTPAMVEAFFVSPWPAWSHPLRDLR